VGQPACTTNPPVVDPVTTCKAVALLVNTSAVSITIGLSTTISDATGSQATAYSYPGSVLVVDNNGAPVANKAVTLTLFPVAYNQGSVGSLTGCPLTYTNVVNGTLAPIASEDVNRNGLLDAGEDVSGNGALSPITADGGAVASTITTNASGLATFEITYPKTSGMFIYDELTARITASGTEGQAKTTFLLPVSASDLAKTPGCPIAGDRPFP
jgi:hypothetical protein